MLFYFDQQSKNLRFIIVLICPRSLMDRILACEAGDPGSIPGEGTTQKKSPLLETFSVLCQPELCFISK